MKLDFKWKESTEGYTALHTAWIGGIKVGQTHYNGVDRDPSKKYIGGSVLPQTGESNKFPSEKEAMEFVELSVRQWFEKLNLK